MSETLQSSMDKVFAAFEEKCRVELLTTEEFHVRVAFLFVTDDSHLGAQIFCASDPEWLAMKKEVDDFIPAMTMFAQNEKSVIGYVMALVGSMMKFKVDHNPEEIIKKMQAGEIDISKVPQQDCLVISAATRCGSYFKETSSAITSFNGKIALDDPTVLAEGAVAGFKRHTLFGGAHEDMGNSKT